MSKNSNYEPLVYYAVNGHMYWIGDKDEALSLIARARTYEDNNKKVNSYIFDEYECAFHLPAPPPYWSDNSLIK